MDGPSFLGVGGGAGYRYPYANEAHLHQRGASGASDRPNPFEQGGEIAKEANSVVKVRKK